MMIDELKKAKIAAMKAKDTDARSILDVVITKIQLAMVDAKAKGADYNDAQSLEIIQKVLKELADEKDTYVKGGKPERAAAIDKQAETIKAYLPSQLSEEEIRAEIAKMDDKSMPSVMKYFKTNFAGRVDMSLVSKVVRGL